jgi:hypothetical protein
MKVETKIYLEPKLLAELQGLLETNGHGSLSDVIEDLLRKFLAKEKLPVLDLDDLKLINDNADRLNLEAHDVLTYQIEL